MESKSIAAALANAQLSMGKALKQSTNPHFRQKYADLGNVMDACLPALNEVGIALIQPTGEEDGKRYVETIFIHGESGETLSCRVPLIVSKNDMQGYGSAVTYARRYGLMAMAGIAPEDDDGSAAVKAKPDQKPDSSRPQTQFDATAFVKQSVERIEGCKSLSELQQVWGEVNGNRSNLLKNQIADLEAVKDKRKAELSGDDKAKQAPVIDDEIPY